MRLLTAVSLVQVQLGELWLHGQVVKTPPFHGGNRGSNPLGVIICASGSVVEYRLAKARVAGSNPVSRSYFLFYKAWWLSWLERRPVTAEVVGSNPIRVASERNNYI